MATPGRRRGRGAEETPSGGPDTPEPRRPLWEEVLERMGGEEQLPDPLEAGEALRASIAERLLEIKRGRHK
jgi:hypothetical protein